MFAVASSNATVTSALTLSILRSTLTLPRKIVVFAPQEQCMCTQKRKTEEGIVYLVQVIMDMALRCAPVAKIACIHTTGGWNARLGQDFIGWDTKVSNVYLFKERERHAWRSHLSINLLGILESELIDRGLTLEMVEIEQCI